MNRKLTWAYWKNGFVTLLDNNGDARMAATARQYLHESKVDIDELITWCEDNRNHPSAIGFNTQSFINELKWIKSKAQR